MKEALLDSVVTTVTGTVDSTAETLTGTASTTSAPASTATPTSTPKTTTATPPTVTLVPASVTSSTPVSTASSTTSVPKATTVTPFSDRSSSAGSSTSTYSSSSRASSVSGSTMTPPPSSTQGNREADVKDVADTHLNATSIVGLVLGALGMVLILVFLVGWCLRRRRKQLMSSLNHVRLGATGDLPVFNTRGTERFETSSSSVSLDPFRTAQSNSTFDRTRHSELWKDEVITAMRIPMEKLTVTKLLSSGGYGEVYRGVYREETVAIKVLLPEKQKDMEQINAFLKEIKMIASIDHPFIVRFLGVAWDSLSDLSAVMEFMEGGDLRALLDQFQQERKPRGFNLIKARIALQTAQALTYLHSLDPKVLHRDLKTKNILLTSKLEAKLSDFGVSRRYTFTGMTAAVWMAPEVMLGDRFDTSADIFSFGVVLSELESHLYPYAEARTTNSGQRVPDGALLQLVATGHINVEFSSNAPAELVELGRACVSVNPRTRPSACEVHYQLQRLLHSYETYTL
ncbi:hypothetical protein DVH05_015450 [Phytophthora capsici]|nr:hypothetical protein DVH05_015450 [Phytophthora capsici]